MYTILVASLNENMKLAKSIQEQLTQLGNQSQIINLVELDLPMYSSKQEEIGIPEKTGMLVQEFENSEGYIIIAPEYNYSIPPILTNVVAWISRVDKDFRKYFHRKNILLATHSGGGGEDVLKDMKTQFTKLGANVIEPSILTTYKKPLNPEHSIQILKAFTSHSKASE